MYGLQLSELQGCTHLSEHIYNLLRPKSMRSDNRTYPTLEHKE